MAELLLVEDDTVLRGTLSRILRSVGLVVTAVGSVLEAQSALQAEKYRIILSDMMLPDGNGVELHSWVVANLTECPPRFFFCSGFMSDELREYVENTKCQFFPKPINIRKLIAAIKDVEPKVTRRLTPTDGVYV